MTGTELFSARHYAEWTRQLKEKDKDFASKIKRERPDLTIKQMLDGRREEMRYAISVESAARLLGFNAKTLRRLVDDPYNLHLETISPNRAKGGHRYLWLEDVLEYSKRIISDCDG